MSAHRTPEKVRDYATSAKERGLKVLIGGAGAAAALPGVLASMTTLPVIGVPLASTPLNGFDSLLSIVQMPPGVPVATVAVGEMGAKNAGHLAAQILALGDPTLAERVVSIRNPEPVPA
jgi:phosphoribosylaminoimidazole carboxylase PurE protein